MKYFLVSLLKLRLNLTDEKILILHNRVGNIFIFINKRVDLILMFWLCCDNNFRLDWIIFILIWLIFLWSLTQIWKQIVLLRLWYDLWLRLLRWLDGDLGNSIRVELIFLYEIEHKVQFSLSWKVRTHMALKIRWIQEPRLFIRVNNPLTLYIDMVIH